jgi:hypothetical protein
LDIFSFTIAVPEPSLKLNFVIFLGMDLKAVQFQSFRAGLLLFLELGGFLLSPLLKKSFL